MEAEALLERVYRESAAALEGEEVLVLRDLRPVPKPHAWALEGIARVGREQNPLIQKLAHRHRESLIELLNLAEGLPLPRRVPTSPHRPGLAGGGTLSLAVSGDWGKKPLAPAQRPPFPSPVVPPLGGWAREVNRFCRMAQLFSR